MNSVIVQVLTNPFVLTVPSIADLCVPFFQSIFSIAFPQRWLSAIPYIPALLHRVIWHQDRKGCFLLCDLSLALQRNKGNQNVNHFTVNYYTRFAVHSEKANTALFQALEQHSYSITRHRSTSYESTPKGTPKYPALQSFPGTVCLLDWSHLHWTRTSTNHSSAQHSSSKHSPAWSTELWMFWACNVLGFVIQAADTPQDPLTRCCYMVNCWLFPLPYT